MLGVINTLLLWSTASEILLRVLRIISWIFLAKFLGPSEFGIFSYFFAATGAMFSTVDLGFNQAIQHKIFSKNSDKDILNYCICKAVLNSTGIVIFSSYCFFQNYSITKLLTAICLMLVLMTLDSYGIISAYLRSQQKFAADFIIKSIWALCSSASLCGAAFITTKADKTALIYFTCSLILVPLSSYTLKNVKRPNIKTVLVLFKNIKETSMQFWFVGVFTTLFLNIDIFIANKYTDTSSLGLYAAAQKIIYVAQLPAAIASQVILQAFAADIYRKKHEWVKKLYYISGILCTLSLLFSAIFLFYSPFIVNICFNENYSVSALCLKQMAYGLIGLFFYPMFSTLLILLNEFKLYIFISTLLIGCIYMIMLKSVLSHGIVGVATAQSLANIILAVCYGAAIIFAISKQKLKSSLLCIIDPGKSSESLLKNCILKNK